MLKNVQPKKIAYVEPKGRHRRIKLGDLSGTLVGYVARATSMKPIHYLANGH